MTDPDLVIAALRRPADAAALPPAGWDLLVRQARRADLLSRLALVFERDGLVSQIPERPAAHLKAAAMLAAAQHLEIRRELDAIALALAPLGLQPVLLKGAAYLLAGEASALGRTFDDVDLLVPRARLPEVEAHLMMGGWATTHHNAYDQRYYREWMHELPPMQHGSRNSVLDVHHAILPLTARLKPDSAKLLAAARCVGQERAWRVLSAPDMLLHSMTHLFHNDDLSHGLRDLSDLDLLLRHHGRDDAFWPELQERALALQLERPLHYGLQLTHSVLGTPVPQPALAAARRHAAAPPLDALMRRCWRASLRSPHPSARVAGSAVSSFALYVRAHALRMPPAMLVQHLLVKAWRRRGGDPAPV